MFAVFEGFQLAVGNVTKASKQTNKHTNKQTTNKTKIKHKNPTLWKFTLHKNSNQGGFKIQLYLCNHVAHCHIKLVLQPQNIKCKCSHIVYTSCLGFGILLPSQKLCLVMQTLIWLAKKFTFSMG